MNLDKLLGLAWAIAEIEVRTFGYDCAALSAADLKCRAISP